MAVTSLGLCGNGVSLDEPPQPISPAASANAARRARREEKYELLLLESPGMQVRLVHEFRFEAAHRLPRVPPGHKCARLHGHSYRVELTIEGPVDPDTGWVIDFDDMARAWAPLQATLDHHCLNEVEGLENPTSEILAGWIWVRIKPMLPMLTQVTIYETTDARCEYRGA